MYQDIVLFVNYSNRLELVTQLDHVVYEHDLIQQQLQAKDQNSYHTLFNQINKWQTESINKIKQAGEEARQSIRQLLDEHKEQLTKDLRRLIDELRKGKKSEDFVETDLDRWKHDVQKLKEELQMPSSIILETKKSPSWITMIKVNTKSSGQQQFLYQSPRVLLPSPSPSLGKRTVTRIDEFTTDLPTSRNQADKFNAEKIYGPIELQDEKKVAVHVGSANCATEVRGTNLYSTGKHRLQLKLEKMHHGYSLFGIVTESTLVQESSISSKSTYGWVPGNNKQAWLKGAGTAGYGGYDGDIMENDVLELVLNCDKKIIQLSNKRTNKLYQIPVDINSCPFPWQFYLSLYEIGDLVRIL
ncbi:unnamed protein product [Didymodactylos carnosus]|uniref:B30.2/SPRY domain-containing protein n=1 Tax=Didymodactylos carnosus TaxID=1234261 RepID=A0A8S2CUW4_9BILA|nr:unnamed protein product [Didymodactylos carnosus]CAF3525179.1 unnamed protein product [Didymodactylos carnosus]